MTYCRRSRRCRSLAALAVAALAGGCSSEPESPLAAVSGFEIERYLGEWHQVAAIPAWFQDDCVAVTTARYELSDDGSVAVTNACLTADGSSKRANARARFLGPASEGRLEVTFVEILGFWMWWAAGDYWIIGLDPDYQWSVVGQPSRRYAWILARNPVPETPTLREAGRILERAGYDTCRLMVTVPGRRGRLCDAIQ